MSTPVIWEKTINVSDMGTPPTSVNDANVVDSKNWNKIVASAEFAGGTSPTITITVYAWIEPSGSFEATGDEIVLDPASENVYIGNPFGLILGFVATATGSPTDVDLHVGRSA